MTTQQEETQRHRHFTQKYADALLSTTKRATKQFPNDPWFAFEYEEAREDFSVWASDTEK